MRSQEMELLWRSARRLGRNAAARKPLPPLLFFTDPARTPNPVAVVRGMRRNSAVVFRAFGGANAVADGLELRAAARARGMLFFVGADAGLAARLQADGLHLPERLAGRAGHVRAMRRRFLVTAAAHGLAAVIRARRSGVDAVVVSPVFASASLSARASMGKLRFVALIGKAGLPVYALGGVNARTARALAGSGASGLAAVDGLRAPERVRT
ncbi:MAG TPA: thiamine phosphate synthase [Caulobacteraceae bacterium]